MKFLVLLLVFFCGALHAADRPNILYIFADDQSDRTVSSYERSRRLVQTPNIDKLAKEGVRFRSAYIGTWCMPSRATFLTGKLQYGIESLRMVGKYPGAVIDSNKQPFWPKYFRQAGYHMAQIGKWHVNRNAGYGREWDYQKVWNRSKNAHNAGAYYDNQLISTNGGKDQLVKGYATDNYTEWAVDYIKGNGRDKNKPWFLWLCYTATHGAFIPAPRHDNIIDDNLQIPFPSDMFAPRIGKPEYVRKRNAWVQRDDGKYYTNKRPPKNGEWHASVKNYHETALGLDEGVGKIIQTLKDTGQLNNTLVIYTSDQGFSWGQHGIQHKLAPYDASLASPLIFSFPGKIPKNKVTDTPVGGHDIVPTLFKFAGVELPWKMHGKDISPILMEPEKEHDHGVLLAYTERTFGSETKSKIPKGDNLDVNAVNWWISYRKGQYKYVLNLIKGEVEELYNLKYDNEELYNLAQDVKHAETLNRFRLMLIKELRNTDSPLLEAAKEYMTYHSGPKLFASQ